MGWWSIVCGGVLGFGTMASAVFIPIQFHTIGVSVKTPLGQEAVTAFSRLDFTLRCVIVGASGVKVGFCRIVRSRN